MPRPSSKHIAKPDILITGASGLLGHALCALARQHWSVQAVFRRNVPQVNGIAAIQLDLTAEKDLQELLRTKRPQAVIHAAAGALVAQCQADPDSFESINVQVPSRLARVCADLGIPLLFTSTDLVFDGTQAPYHEECRPTPFCVYSDQKVRAEHQVLSNYPRALVCRLPLLVGLSPYAWSHFTVQMLAAIAEHRALTLFVDEYRTPVDVQSAARGILTVLGRANGLLHLGGRTRVSRHALGLMMAEAMQVAPTMIHPARVKDAPASMPRAPDCCLDSRRAYALGYDPLPLVIAVRNIVARFLDLR